jgi:hypothetical protein
MVVGELARTRALSLSAAGGILAGVASLAPLAACAGSAGPAAPGAREMPEYPPVVDKRDSAPRGEGSAAGARRPTSGSVAARQEPSNCCKGRNACKGMGSCKTDRHACKGLNDCKGMGGCKPYDCKR